MDEEEKYTLEEAHLKFAKMTNGLVWQLLGKPDRTTEDNEIMVLTANASLFHWLHAGTAHIYAELGEGAPSLRYALRCMELTEQHRNEMADFDVAYAYEAMARANALLGRLEEARPYFGMAKEAGEKISDAEDKEIFTGDFNGGIWHGIG
jgi:hypothetical protein